MSQFSWIESKYATWKRSVPFFIKYYSVFLFKRWRQTTRQLALVKPRKVDVGTCNIHVCLFIIIIIIIEEQQQQRTQWWRMYGLAWRFASFRCSRCCTSFTSFFFSFILCISFPFFIVVIPGVPHFLCLCPPPPLLLLAVCITLCVVPVCFVAFYLFFLFSVYHLPFFCCVCVLSHTSAHLRTFYLSTIFFFVFTSSFVLRFVFFF